MENLHYSEILRDTDVKNKVIKAIEDFNMLDKGQEVLVGLSGGADSVALLLVLSELGYKVSACHINHQLRGEESDRDESFCIKLCNSLNIELFVEKLDVNTYCKENKLGTEEGARELRYITFSKYCGNNKIATAHTASDNIETVLINFTRGTALKGLCGIPPVRDNIIRPLIYCTREEVEEYLKEKNQSYVTDSTNLTTDYTRNKIRHEVIPVLKSINPSLENSFLKTNQSISRDNSYLEEIADKILKEITILKGTYNANILREMDTSISFRCIAKILKTNGLECNSERVNDIYNIVLNNGKINLSGNVYAISNSGKLKISVIKKEEKVVLEQPLVTDKEITFFDKKFIFYKQNYDENNWDLNVNKKFTIGYLDYDKIECKVIVRNRRNGDKIRFASRPHTTSVKKLFNSDIPLEERDKILFLADEKGVIFIEGYGVAERVRVDENTKNILTINLLEGNVKN